MCEAKPDKVNFTFAGPGSRPPQHLALELFKQRAGSYAMHVAYEGSALVVTALIGGQVQHVLAPMTAATPHLKGGRLMAIARTRAKSCPM